MHIQREDLRPNAYVREVFDDDDEDTNLYRVDRVKVGQGYVQVILEDVRSPLTSERLPDPDVPGKLGASMVLKPRVRSLALGHVQERFELVLRAPGHPDDVANEGW